MSLRVARRAVNAKAGCVKGLFPCLPVNTGFEPVEVDLGRFGKFRLDSYELRYLR